MQLHINNLTVRYFAFLSLSIESLDTLPMVPSEWWDDYLSKEEAKNNNTCQRCTSLRNQMREIVIHQKDTKEEKKLKNKERSEITKALENHRYVEFPLFFF
jgi:hypothetical protein